MEDVIGRLMTTDEAGITSNAADMSRTMTQLPEIENDIGAAI